jgi:ParB-like chromosome segregation protein Spo0J
MKVELMSIEKLVPYARNPRITAHAVDKVAASIKEFGFRQPIVVDSEMVIIVGHVRYQAAQKLGLKKVPVHVMEGATPEQVKAYRIADNRTGEEAEWDRELLQLEINELDTGDFDKSVLGFNEEELNSLRLSLESLQDGIEGEEDGELEEADTKATIGPYTFVIERGQYLEWMEQVRQRVGFDKEAIVDELKRRLGL